MFWAVWVRLARQTGQNKNSSSWLRPAFALARRARIAHQADSTIAPVLTVLLCISALAALAAVVLGSRGVAHAEKSGRRANPLARLSAGMGVVTLGGTGGVVLFILVMLYQFGAEAAPLATEAEHLSAVSYVVLAGMATILVGGLGWCFYRAIKASTFSP